MDNGAWNVTITAPVVPVIWKVPKTEYCGSPLEKEDAEALMSGMFTPLAALALYGVERVEAVPFALAKAVATDKFSIPLLMLPDFAMEPDTESSADADTSAVHGEMKSTIPAEGEIWSAVSWIEVLTTTFA